MADLSNGAPAPSSLSIVEATSPSISTEVLLEDTTVSVGATALSASNATPSVCTLASQPVSLPSYEVNMTPTLPCTSIQADNLNISPSNGPTHSSIVGNPPSNTSKPAVGPNNSQSKWLNPDNNCPDGQTRLERTTRILLPKGVKGYSREMFIEHLNDTVGTNKLEACGPTNAPHIWQLTFLTKGDKDAFEKEGDFQANGQTARIIFPRDSPNRKRTRFYIRVHWIPYHIHMTKALLELDSIPGIRILSANYDQCRTPGMEHVRTTVRTVCIETEDTSLIPFYMKWGTKTEGGTAMITMKDRPPKCLKCGELGHVRKDCKAVKCSKCNAIGHTTESCMIKALFSSVVGNVPLKPNEIEGEVIEEDEEDGIPPSASPLNDLSATEYPALPTLPPAGSDTPPINNLLRTEGTIIQHSIETPTKLDSMTEQSDMEDSYVVGQPASVPDSTYDTGDEHGAQSERGTPRKAQDSDVEVVDLALLGAAKRKLVGKRSFADSHEENSPKETDENRNAQRTRARKRMNKRERQATAQKGGGTIK